ILTGGDYINNHENKEEVINRLKNFKDRFKDRSNVFITLGNHDDNSNYKDFTKVITHEEMKKLMFSDMKDVTFGNGLYYYKDFHEHKIRLIVLNSEDIPEYDPNMIYKGQWDYAFSNEQLNWVAHTALNTDYKIIFCSHTPMVENVEGFDYPIKNVDAMLGIMKAYNLGESYSSSNTTGDFKYNVSVTYNKKGTIVCCLFGHVHADNIVYKDNIAHISTTCSNCSYRYGSSHIENATGTVNEIALDFLTVRNKTGYLTRFGAGSDRSFTYVNNTKESKKEKSYLGLKLFGQNKELIALLQNVKDLNIESVLESGDKTLSFSYAKKDKFYNYIIEENYIRTKTDEFVIKSRDINGDYTAFTCVLNLEELEGKIVERFESVEQTITAALNLAVVGTGWTIQDNTLKKKRTVRCTNKNALEIVKEIKKTYRVDIVFNTLEKKIEIYEHLGEDKGTYFIDSLNLTALQVQSDSYKFATRIVAEGKDGLTFENINNGKNYVENYQYSNKIKTIYWKDERYTVKESLLEDAKAKLEELSKPFTSYNASVLNLAELNPKYKSILDYSLGDTITLLSKSNKVRDKQRIVKTLEYPQDHTKDTVELANATLKFEDIQQENQETTDTVNNITSDNGTLDSNAIEDNSIEIKKIDNFEANVLKVTKLDVINANIENLHANKADIQDLNAVKATVGQLEATKANITQLNATNAEISKLDTLKANIVDLNSATAKIGVLEAKTTSIDNLLSQKADIKDLNTLNATISDALIKKATIAELEALETKTNKLIADKANIIDLNATNANINKIQAETANIKTLLNGNLSSENIQAGGITSDKLTIANGFITNLMISSVSASKITAGTIDAAKINVVNLNADNLTVGKINGQLLKDESISGLAIENGAIDNNKVSPNANIEASKININSVVTAINAGSTLLTANKVSIDSEKGTLDVAFNKLNTSLEANKKATESNLTAINVVQGKLSTSIENSKILEGKQKTLEDNYNRTVATVDSLKNTIGEQKTLIDSATGKITSVEVKANTLEKDLSGLTQTVTDTKKVIENNKTSLESKNAELKANIDKVSSSLSSVSNTVDKNNKTLVAKTNTLEQNLNGLTQTVESNKTVTDGKITSVESETHELKAGLGGLTSKLDTLKSTTDGINKTVSNQGSVINQLKDSINLKVDSSTFTQSTQTINNNINKAKEDAVNAAKANTTNAISDLKIGGRNYGLNTNVMQQDPYNIAFSKDLVFEKGKTYTISMDFDVENLIKGSQERVGCEGSILFTDGTRQYIGLWHWINEGTTFKGRKSYTFTIENKDIKENMTGVHIYTELVSSGKRLLGKFKLEDGTKATDYTEAPEDLKKYSDEIAKAKADLAQANAIASADGKITVEEKKRIQQAEANLNTAIAKADKAKADAISEANRVSELKKNEAIKTAGLDATNKANNALNSAKAYTNAEITTVNTHLNKNTSEINILKDKIESKVSQSDINKSIQNINFSDINMILNSANFKDTSNWGITNGSDNLFIENNCLVARFKNYANWGCYVTNDSLRNRPLETSKEYTVVCRLKASRNQTIGFNICDGNANNHVYARDLNITTEWKIFKFTFKPASVGNERQFRFITSNLGYEFNLYIDFVKMVEGSTSSDNWTIAPDYVVNKITNITDQISTVESNLTQTKNSITANVKDLNSKTESITTNVSNINRDLTNKINSNLDVAKNFATDKSNAAKQEAILGARTIPDTRNDNQSPGWYMEHYPKQLINEFKNANVLGITGTIYGILETKVPWDNSSGGFPVQTFRSNTTATYQRKALNETTWSNWEQIEDTQGSQAKATNALDNAKNYTNAQINTVNTKVHNIESNITILTDRINSKVSQSDVDKSISTIQIGGRNYGLATNIMKQEPYNVSFSSALVFEKNKTYTISLDFDVENLVAGSQSRVGCECSIGFDDNTRFYIGIWHYINQGNFKGRKSFTFTLPNKNIVDIPKGIHIYTELVSSGKRLLGKLKLEEGNKATDYTEAPEDTNQLIVDNIRVVDTKISDVSSNVTQLKDSVTTQINSINSKTQSIESNLSGKASKQEVTDVNNRVTTIKANLDSITQRVSSTESKTNSLETNINGKASKQELTVVNKKVTEVTASLNGITQRVGNTESRINTLDGKVAGAVTLQQFTEFKQSNDKFKFTVEQRSSVSNILPNSSFHGGDRGWLHGGVEFWAGAYSGYGFKGRITGAIKNRAAYNNPERYLQTHKAYKVKKNTTYTINFHYICEKNVQSMDAFVVLSDTEHGDYAQPICVLTAQGGSQSNATEEKPFTYKFNTGNHEWVWIRFDHNGMKSGVNWDEFCWVYVSEIGIYEGDVGAVKWTPKGGEVYSANYQMDGLGFKGTFEDGTYAQLGRDGFEWYNAGTGHAYHALTYVTSFDVPIGNPGKAYIKLPAEFTKRRNSLKWTVALRGYYYNTTGNFFPFHIHCTGGRDYIENGLVVCEVQGYCKIQNAQNAGDIQFRPLTAMLIAIA
ncbi:TPA: hypothetical protein I9078_002410, partial [Clostridium perfringens]|nr:hypothetical protein [Clostridium perfringens]